MYLQIVENLFPAGPQVLRKWAVSRCFLSLLWPGSWQRGLGGDVRNSIPNPFRRGMAAPCYLRSGVAMMVRRIPSRRKRGLSRMTPTHPEQREQTQEPSFSFRDVNVDVALPAGIEPAFAT